MSILSVRDIQGISAYSNTVRVPAGHNFETYGKLVANGTLKVPSWTTATRPGTPEVGMIGYNTQVEVTEIYTGSTNGWVSVGSSVTKTLSQSVGVTPILHYQASDLTTYSDGTVLNSSNFWKNNGSYGSTYDLINDTSSHFSSNVTVTTQGGKKAANFSGFCGLAFKSAAYFNFCPASSYPLWTVAYVYGGGTSASSTTNYSPSFSGHNQGPGTGIPDRVGGGLFGWGNPQWGTNSTYQHWYDNDGGAIAGDPGGDNATINQYVNVVNTNASQNIQKSWKGKTSGPFYNGSISGISIGAGPTYGASILISGMSNTRRVDSSSWTTTGYVLDAVLFNVALTDAQVQSLRDYYAILYPVGNVAS
jgi:hypothetical protein